MRAERRGGRPVLLSEVGLGAIVVVLSQRLSEGLIDGEGVGEWDVWLV